MGVIMLLVGITFCIRKDFIYVMELLIVFIIVHEFIKRLLSTISFLKIQNFISVT